MPRWLLSTNTENITGNDGLAVTKAGNHLFSTQLLPKLTRTGELLPAGAGEPTKPMVLAEKLWQGLDPCPLASTCSARVEHKEDPSAACGLCGDPAGG